MGSSGWVLALQVFKNGKWSPLRQERYATKRFALGTLRKHIEWADRSGLDRRNFAAINWESGDVVFM